MLVLHKHMQRDGGQLTANHNVRRAIDVHDLADENGARHRRRLRQRQQHQTGHDVPSTQAPKRTTNAWLAVHASVLQVLDELGVDDGTGLTVWQAVQVVVDQRPLEPQQDDGRHPGEQQEAEGARQ
jgi:hypothetical protein